LQLKNEATAPRWTKGAIILGQEAGSVRQRPLLKHKVSCFTPGLHRAADPRFFRAPAIFANYCVKIVT